MHNEHDTGLSGIDHRALRSVREESCFNALRMRLTMFNKFIKAMAGMTQNAQPGRLPAIPNHKPSAPKTKARSLLPMGPS